ncbi:PREDICTED: bidirectional sugar transporter SWEET12-like, partial [Erythranthe guttata]|uniref:bidirectional sugar transporter SWEET12-like n=1 Tax=Erythranthe guttata TaxID=4155 RepID=UPI00064DA21C
YTFSKIRDVKSTVGYTVIPYTIALFASAIWLYYAAIRSYAVMLVIINSTGYVIEMAYVVIFFYYWVRAVRTRSVQGIPLTAYAVIWDIYGFAKGDVNIKIPNIIRLVLGIGQIVVYVIFRTPQTSETTRESQTAETI